MSRKNRTASTTSDIREIIEEEIKNNPKIGFIKNDLFFMKVDANPILFAPLNLLYWLQILLCVPLFLIEKKVLIENDYAFYALIPCILIFILLFVNSICSHFLIYDFKNECFYTISCLLHITQLKIIKSYNISTQNIKRIILQIQNYYAGKKTILYERIILYLNHNIEMVLADFLPCTSYHEITLQRCILFSKCFNVDYKVIGIEKYERMIKSFEDSKKNLPFFIILLIIIALVIIYGILT